MAWVELIGPSGIGKTTFQYAMLRSASKQNAWRLPGQALRDIARRNNNTGFINAFRRIYLRQNVITAGQGRISKHLLDFNAAYFEEAHKYNYLLAAVVEDYAGRGACDGVEKAYRISLFKTIIDTLCVLDFYDYDRLVLFDEGPFNHCRRALMEYITPGQVLPKALVFCYLSPDENFKRLKTRKAIAPSHRGLDDVGLKKYIRASHRKYEEIIEGYKHLDIPYIEIDLQEESNKNEKKALTFLDDLAVLS